MNPFLVILRFVMGLWTFGESPMRPALVRVSAPGLRGARIDDAPLGRPGIARVRMQRGGRLTFPNSFLPGAPPGAIDTGSWLSYALTPWRQRRRR